MTDPPERRAKAAPPTPAASAAPANALHTSPTPGHSWRAFLGELGVVVLGVMIALAAQQVVDTLHWRGEVADARQAMAHEILANLRVMEVLRRQDPCRVRVLA